VRDKIPQIIRSKGLEPVIYTASIEEYATRLRDKLREEVEEFIASDDDPEELADILEVLLPWPGRRAPTSRSWKSCARPRPRIEATGASSPPHRQRQVRALACAPPIMYSADGPADPRGPGEQRS
jgi:hypothetical protein